MSDEIRTGLLQDVRDLDAPAMSASAANGTEGGMKPKPDHDKSDSDADGTDSDSDASDRDSDGTDNGDADGTDNADADGTDNA